jgi:hypothetical protein
VTSPGKVHAIIAKAPSTGPPLFSWRKRRRGHPVASAWPARVAQELLEGRARWIRRRAHFGPGEVLAHSWKDQEQDTFPETLPTSPRARADAARIVIVDAAEGATPTKRQCCARRASARASKEGPRRGRPSEDGARQHASVAARAAAHRGSHARHAFRAWDEGK